jgi:hypothetical protein
MRSRASAVDSGNSQIANSVIAISPRSQPFVRRVSALLVRSADPTQAELDALKASNPQLFAGWSVATLLNAKAWGISLSPGLFTNFQVTIKECASGSQVRSLSSAIELITIDNVRELCSASYVIPEMNTLYEMNAIPQIASTVAAQDSTVLNEYGTPIGEEVSRSLFGIHAPANWVSDFDSPNPTGADGPIDPATIPDVPVGYTRLWDTETTWADLEPTRGTFVWRKIDKQIQLAQAVNARVMLVLGKTPSWAGPSAKSMPTDISDWRTYVRTVCQRYGASISSYEVWNEANLQTFWTGTAAQMADLTKAAFEEIRGCNPNALVIDRITIIITSALTGDRESYTAVETGPNTGIFVLSDVPVVDASRVATIGGDGTIQSVSGDRLSAQVNGCGAVITIAEIQIDPAGVVFDTLTCQPVAGVTVTLIDVLGNGNGGRPNQPAFVLLADGVTPSPNPVTTGSDGRYEFPLVRPSVYRIAAAGPSGVGESEA